MTYYSPCKSYLLFLKSYKAIKLIVLNEIKVLDIWSELISIILLDFRVAASALLLASCYTFGGLFVKQFFV